MVDDIGHEGLRILLREEGVRFQRLKTWKGSTDPEFKQEKARIERLYAIADGEAEPREGEPEVVICVDELGRSICNRGPGQRLEAHHHRLGPAGRSTEVEHAPGIASARRHRANAA